VNSKQLFFLLAGCCVFIAPCSGGAEPVKVRNTKLCPTNGPTSILGSSFLEDFGQDGDLLATKPEDVRYFVENAATCEHFAGEEPYDEERRTEIRIALGKYCKKALELSTLLKGKYSQNADILQILSVCDKGSPAVCSSFDGE
jgi:hypothetical protein